MRQTREILRQKWCLGQSHRAVAQSLRLSSGTVGTTVLARLVEFVRAAQRPSGGWGDADGPDDVLTKRTEPGFVSTC